MHRGAFSAILRSVELDPHTLQQILEKVRQQLRCPQCGKKVPIEFSSLKFVGDHFVVFQLKCETCDAFIMLHATVAGIPLPESYQGGGKNISNSLQLAEDEIEILRKALRETGGSFSALFKRLPLK
jgi:hypothetical protein